MKKSADEYYKIIYSKIERVLSYRDIKNDIAREVLTYFKMPPVEIIYTADIPSSGSGLASSSSYMINLIKACLQFQGKEITSTRIGELAIMLERNFNPLTGYQDVWGCLREGFKALKFDSNGLTSYQNLPDTIFKKYDFYLVPTDATRSSTDVLETIDYGKVHEMSSTTNLMLDALIKEEYDKVNFLIKSGWEQKKLTSPSIVNEKVKAIETILSRLPNISSYRLIGAGNGGYFLVLTEKNSYLSLKNIKIDLHDE
jgi:D-glycero-alpha-D-manno-heptose-7-phosphate kinase